MGGVSCDKQRTPDSRPTFDAFRETESNHDLLVIARTYAEEFDRMVAENQGLIFYGQPGTGKTFAAACIVNYLLDRKVPVLMTSFVKLMDQFMCERNILPCITSWSKNLADYPDSRGWWNEL